MPETTQKPQTTKIGWLIALMEEIQSIPDEQLAAPRTKLEPGEEVIGKITDKSLRQLYTAANRANAEALRARADHAAAASEQEEEAASVKHGLAYKKCELLRQLFWLGVQGSVATAPHGVGLRANWEVIALPESEVHPALRSLLGALSG